MKAVFTTCLPRECDSLMSSLLDDDHSKILSITVLREERTGDNYSGLIDILYIPDYYKPKKEEELTGTECLERALPLIEKAAKSGEFIDPVTFQIEEARNTIRAIIG